MLILIPFIRESPTFLLKRGREKEAYEAYSYIRNLPEDHPYIAEDVAFVRQHLEVERSVNQNGNPSIWSFLRGAGRESMMKGIRNRFVLVFIMFMWQAWSGAAAINYCMPFTPFVALCFCAILTA